MVCREQLTLHTSPGLTLYPHAARFTISDMLDSCNSRDPTLDRGIAIVKNTGPQAACGAGGVFHGVAWIRWNNGKVTRIRDQVLFADTVAMGRGKTVGGSEFAGEPIKAVDKVVIDPIVLGLCASPRGVGVLTAEGEFQIGPANIDGVPFAP